MKTRQHSVRCIVGLFALALALVMMLYLAPAAQVQKDSAKASMQTKGGLNIVNFDTLNGKVIVNLPDDMRAGDTISGTVVTEPKGNDDAERARNESVLNGYVIEVKPPHKKSGQLSNVMIPVSRGLPLLIFLGGGEGDQASRNVCEIMLLPTNPDARGTSSAPRDIVTPIGTIMVAVPPRPIPPPVGTVMTSSAPDKVQLPTLGQQGRPIDIPGPFDGNSSNTNVKIGGQDVPILAESPRKAIFKSPANVTGPAEIQVKEGNTETKGPFRNVGVNLTAPKTSLLKGESTEVHVQVSGLEGITAPVPLHLTKAGVVSMQGGDVQTMSIQPAEVKNDGSYTTTRTITGQQTGAFTVTATVVVFDLCLQDDNNGSMLIFSSETGDYRFCSFAPGLNVVMASTDTPGGLSGSTRGSAGTSNLSDPHLDTGHYDLTINKSVITFDHQAPDRRVLINLSSGSFPPSATATVQTTNPKRKFTITDRDTRNNTCACK